MGEYPLFKVSFLLLDGRLFKLIALIHLLLLIYRVIFYRNMKGIGVFEMEYM